MYEFCLTLHAPGGEQSTEHRSEGGFMGIKPMDFDAQIPLHRVGELVVLWHLRGITGGLTVHTANLCRNRMLVLTDVLPQSNASQFKSVTRAAKLHDVACKLGGLTLAELSQTVSPANRV